MYDTSGRIVFVRFSEELNTPETFWNQLSFKAQLAPVLIMSLNLIILY